MKESLNLKMVSIVEIIEAEEKRKRLGKNKTEPQGRVCVCSVMSDSLGPHGLQVTRLFCPWDFPGKNTRVGCHFLLQRIFPTQGLNSCLPSLLLWQVGSLSLSHLGNPNQCLPDGKGIVRWARQVKGIKRYKLPVIK